MTETTLDTIDQLLAGAIEDIDDAEAIYKLRSARQLVDVLHKRDAELDEVIEEAIDDDELLTSLQELGYLQ